MGLVRGTEPNCLTLKPLSRHPSRRDILEQKPVEKHNGRR